MVCRQSRHVETKTKVWPRVYKQFGRYSWQDFYKRLQDLWANPYKSRQTKSLENLGLKIKSTNKYFEQLRPSQMHETNLRSTTDPVKSMKNVLALQKALQI